MNTCGRVRSTINKQCTLGKQIKSKHTIPMTGRCTALSLAYWDIFPVHLPCILGQYHARILPATKPGSRVRNYLPHSRCRNRFYWDNVATKDVDAGLRRRHHASSLSRKNTLAILKWDPWEYMGRARSPPQRRWKPCQQRNIESLSPLQVHERIQRQPAFEDPLGKPAWLLTEARS